MASRDRNWGHASSAWLHVSNQIPSSNRRCCMRAYCLATYAVLLLCACDRAGPTDRVVAQSVASPVAEAGGSHSSSIVIRGAGSTFVNPIMQRWIGTYAPSSMTQVVYSSVGSTEGIRRIVERTVDFGVSDVAISEDELALAKDPIVQIPLTVGAVTVAYNRSGLASRLKLSKRAVAGIFLGEIRKWNDPQIAATNRDVVLPDLNITVVFRSDGSGTTGAFTRYLAEASSTWKSDIGSGKSVRFPVGHGAMGSQKVAAELSGSPGAIGYVELTYAKQADLSLGYAMLENSSGRFIEPTIESIGAAAERAAASMPDDMLVSLVNV